MLPRDWMPHLKVHNHSLDLFPRRVTRLGNSAPSQIYNALVKSISSNSVFFVTT